MDYDVVILGAGISGLCASKILTKKGLSVLLLEARSRPGGRIHSVYLGDKNDEKDDKSFDTASTFNVDEPGTGVMVDLGANYLIGCNMRQSDQPLYHIAKILRLPSSVAAGDLIKKYRGWECVELSAWRDFNGQPICHERIGEFVFLFDRVLSLAMHYHKVENYQLKMNMRRSSLTFEQIFLGAKEKMLLTEFECGLRDSPVLQEDDEKIFQSITVRYLSYVNPLDRLSRVLFDNLSNSQEDEKTLEGMIDQRNKRHYVTWQYDRMTINNCISNSSGEESNASSNCSEKSSTEEIFEGLSDLAKRLALQYPTKEDREAYYSLLNEKFEILSMKPDEKSFNEKDKDRQKKRPMKRKKSSPPLDSMERSPSSDSPTNNSFVDTEKFYNLSLPHSTNVCGVSWEDRLMTDRFNELIEPLIKNQKILYNSVVKQVRWTCPDFCEISVLDRKTGESREFRGKHVICTLPVGVLKGLSETSRVTFEPELPQWKRVAINRLGIPSSGADNHEKVILRFDENDIFWDADAVHLKCPDPRLHILNLHRYGKVGVLCAHIWGGSGLNTSQETDQTIIQTILDLLYKMYPKSSSFDGHRIRPISWIVTRWSSDPFSLGSYTSGEPESVESDRLDYAKTLNDDKEVPRLFFAGEATLNSDQAKECTHGALITGLDRSFELLEYLGSQKKIPKKNLNDPNTLKYYFSLIKCQLARYLLDKNGRYSYIERGYEVINRRKNRFSSSTSPQENKRREDSDTDPCMDETYERINLPNNAFLDIIVEEEETSGGSPEQQPTNEFNFCNIIPNELSLQMVK